MSLRLFGLWVMGEKGINMKIIAFLMIGIFLTVGSEGDGADQKWRPELRSGSERAFFYTANKFGIPILRAVLKIENGTPEQGTPLYQVHVSVDSLRYLGLFFRMKNRFTSTIKAETCVPVRYVKIIDQEGLLFEKKNYTQTLTFDRANKKVVVEKKGEEGRQEITVPAETYDPLSMFARCYLREEFHPGQAIQMSLYDGVKLRQMVFHSKKEKVKSRIYGEVEAVCLESITSFSTFGDKEGIIRIWYTNGRERIPISMELELPVGNVRFELEEVKEN